MSFRGPPPSQPLPDQPGSALTRRTFLQSVAAGGAGLTLSFCARPDEGAGPPPSEAPFAPNAFIRIAIDGTVTVVLGQSELGQGAQTALAMILAEELDAAWDSVVVETAPAHPAYANPLMQTQRTAWSASVRGWWLPLREAGARARSMLIAEAAERWGVDPERCVASNGIVQHSSTARTLRYGDLAAAAGLRLPPRRVSLKTADEFHLIGTSPLRLDIPTKTDGSAVYGIDVVRPGILTASLAHAPAIGSRPDSVDDTEALAQNGVRRVVRLSNAVAVLADTWWAAERGRRALRVGWSPADPAADSEAIRESLMRALESDGAVIESRGSVSRMLDRADSRIDAQYEAPHLAHATMEPMTCAAHVEPDRCTVWVPTQNQAGALEAAARASGLPQDRVDIHTTMVGGAFGRRVYQDFVIEAVRLSRETNTAVKVVWTREDDFQHDRFRPHTIHRVSGALDREHRLEAWHHRVAGGFGADGARSLPYAIRHFAVEHHAQPSPVPEGLWRSVDFSHNAFVVESFMDELALSAGADPYAFRRELLADRPRERNVLDRVAELASWGTPVEGRYQGLALTVSHDTVVALVAEVTFEDGIPRVHRIVTAIDCGVVVHPEGASAQVEGAVTMGLSAALREEILLRDGTVESRNFDRYPVLRMKDAPDISVHFLASGEPPGGLGEPALPPVAPALGNAIFQATGVRVRRLPFVVGGALRV